jgi:hypothetical protein
MKDRMEDGQQELKSLTAVVERFDGVEISEKIYILINSISAVLIGRMALKFTLRTSDSPNIEAFQHHPVKSSSPETSKKFYYLPPCNNTQKLSS